MSVSGLQVPLQSPLVPPSLYPSAVSVLDGRLTGVRVTGARIILSRRPENDLIATVCKEGNDNLLSKLSFLVCTFFQDHVADQNRIAISVVWLTIGSPSRHC